MNITLSIQVDCGFLDGRYQLQHCRMQFVSDQKQQAESESEVLPYPGELK